MTDNFLIQLQHTAANNLTTSKPWDLSFGLVEDTSLNKMKQPVNERDTEVDSTRSSDNGAYIDGKEGSSRARLDVERQCNDIIFLVAFLAVFVMTLVFAAQYGPTLINETQVTGEKTTGFKKVLGYTAMFGGASIGISLGWVVIMMFLGEFVIWASIIAMILACVLAAIFMTKRLHDRDAKLYWWPAPIFGLLALLITLYAVCIRRRVKFAAAHLAVAGSALFRLPMTLVVALIMVVVQLAWAITWFLGTYGLYNHMGYITPNNYCSDVDNLKKCKLKVRYGPVIGMSFPMLIVFFWGATVIKNIVSVTVSGTVASWKVNANSPLITLSAWLRAMTYNLGSICLGSLVVAILEAIQTILSSIARLFSASGNCCVACIAGCLACCIGCIRSMVEMFNRFAYAYVGIHGYGFVKAGSRVSQLFNSKGWTGVVNDDLTQKVFWLGNLVVGGLTCFIAVVVVADQVEKKAFEFPGVKRPEYMVGFFAFLVGYIVNNLFMSLMGGAVSTIFVLWAEDPQGWQQTRPDHYARLHTAWLKIYPDEYNNGSGKPEDALSTKQDPVAKA
ncbi:unnamed protein product [Aphanomyces euteiches]